MAISALKPGAVRTIQMIHTAQVQYNSQFGRYAVSLAELGPPASGVASSSAANLVNEDLASGTALGYKFVVRGNESGYVINTIPEIYGTTGRRTFYSDQTMVIRESNGPNPPRPVAMKWVHIRMCGAATFVPPVRDPSTCDESGLNCAHWPAAGPRKVSPSARPIHSPGCSSPSK